MFDTLATIGYLHLIMSIKLVIFVWAMLGVKYYENLVIDFINNQWPTVIFVEFIEVQKYMLLL